MTKPVRPARSRPDHAADSILAFVEVLLDDFFVAPDNQKSFKRLVRGGRKAGVEAVSIGSIDLSDRGGVRLEMQAGSPEINVTITHPQFNANIVARYDLNSAMMSAARIVRIDGDTRKAANCADKWFAELASSFLDDIDLESLDDALTALASGDELPFAGEDDPGEPPPPSPRDKIVVTRLAEALGREMKRKNPDLRSHHDGLLALEHSPQMLWPILDGMIAACTAAKRDDALIDAWRFLLESQLTLIRYRIDSGWDWAVRMAEEYQRKLIAIGHEGGVLAADFAAMAGAMGEARIEVEPEIRVALADAGLTLPEQQQPAELQDMLRGLMDQMASAVLTPFEVSAGLGEATRVMPSAIRCFMAHEFAQSSHAVLRDSVPMMLLAEEKDVRQAAADALKQVAAPDTMSPEALRRMIAIRNWIPAADRPSIDKAIREARAKGVECAQWPPAVDLMITASTIDGSGSQSIILTSRRGRKGVLAGMLLKLASGVADCWCDPEASRNDINETVVTIRQTGASAEVDRAYLDHAVQHAIAVGTASGKPPGDALLQIAELFGGASWRDHRLEVATEAKRLLDTFSEGQRSPAGIEASLTRSGEWIHEAFADSWFLDDADIRAIVGRGPRGNTDQTIRRLLAEAMPKRRAEWAQRFLLLALRARAATAPAQKAYANDMIVLANTLSGDRDLAAIPLMVAIARHTVEVSRIARW